MEFEERQKTMILRCIETEPRNYVQIHKKTGIPIESVRGRTSEIRKKGLLAKHGDEDFKITNAGIQYLNHEV